jgi:hypothetical protein
VERSCKETLRQQINQQFASSEIERTDADH